MRYPSSLEHTRYELAAQHEDRRVLIGYTPRKGGAGMLAMLRARGPAVAALFGTEIITFAKRVGDGATTATGWTIRFTGRTQREAIQMGELPDCAD